MARPLKEVDEKMIQNLARIHCSYSEIASLVGLHENTLIERYGAMIEEYRNVGKMGLRRKLFELSEKGNIQAGIWLSKNILGMSDKVVTANITMNDDGQKKQDVQILLDDLKKAFELKSGDTIEAQSDQTHARRIPEVKRDPGEER